MQRANPKRVLWLEDEVELLEPHLHGGVGPEELILPVATPRRR